MILVVIKEDCNKLSQRLTHSGVAQTVNSREVSALKQRSVREGSEKAISHSCVGSGVISVTVFLGIYLKQKVTQSLATFVSVNSTTHREVSHYVPTLVVQISMLIGKGCFWI